MISRPTVLVLGAGASAPYGLPVASDLRRLIISGNEEIGQWAFSGRPDWRSRYAEFREGFKQSHVASIDAYLEHREALELRAGKRIMAAHIAAKEHFQSLLEPRAPESDWLMRLFTILSSATDPANIACNQLTVVTFNYDRSFELALYLHLKHKYGLSDEEAAAAAKTIPVHHVYGILEELAYAEPGPPKPYASELRWLEGVEDRVRLVHEELKENPTVLQAKNAVAEADRVIFLGFSFHEMNCSNLFTARRAPDSLWFASGMGLRPGEREVARRRAPSSRSKRTLAGTPRHHAAHSIAFADFNLNASDTLAEFADMLVD